MQAFLIVVIAWSLISAIASVFRSGQQDDAKLGAPFLLSGIARLIFMIWAVVLLQKLATVS